jgi:hypothetical protein
VMGRFVGAVPRDVANAFHGGVAHGSRARGARDSVDGFCGCGAWLIDTYSRGLVISRVDGECEDHIRWPGSCRLVRRPA